MAFGWAGAAAGAQGAVRQQAQDASDLETQLAEREYRRQSILVQQAQNERLKEQMAMEQQRFAAQQAQAQTAANRDQDQRGVQRLVGEMIKTQGITPQNRHQIVGTLMEAGRMPTQADLAGPEEQTPYTLSPGQKRFGADNQEVAGVDPRPAAAGADPVVRVETMENGKRVIKFLPRSQVAGQTFAAPVSASGGSSVSGLGSRAIPAAQKEDLITMGTLNDMSNQAEKLGNQIGWNGVGGMFAGSMSQFGARHLGTGTQSEQELRNLIGNITATLAKLRGGTSFTANEQALLEQYTPTINDGDKVIQAKLKSMRQFIQTKRDNTLKVIGGDLSLDDGGPVVGEHRTINGQLAEWDGAGWLPAGAQ
jgi:hypothetical protein